MINPKELKCDDVIYYCCKYHWKCSYKVKYFDERNNKLHVSYNENFGCIYKRGENEVITSIGFERCFNTEEEAEKYQNECKQKYYDMSKDEIIKYLYNKSKSWMTDAEYKLFQEIIDKKCS